jgi:hypothetical protein
MKLIVLLRRSVTALLAAFSYKPTKLPESSEPELREEEVSQQVVEAVIPAVVSQPLDRDRQMELKALRGLIDCLPKGWLRFSLSEEYWRLHNPVLTARQFRKADYELRKKINAAQSRLKPVRRKQENKTQATGEAETERQEEERDGLLVLPQKFSWLNQEGIVVYSREFMREYRDLLTVRERWQLLDQLLVLCSRGPRDPALNTRKYDQDVPYSPKPCLVSYGAPWTRFSHGQDKGVLTLYWLWRKGNKRVKISER